MTDRFYIKKNNVYAIPCIHYNMEVAAQVRVAVDDLKPNCVAVELAETMSLQLQHAASRLPDISVVISYDKNNEPLYYMSEPCDATFEGLRSAIEQGIPAYCIDLDIDRYPEIKEVLPDPYAIQRIGLEEYYKIYKQTVLEKNPIITKEDERRELYMAHRLKELSLRYDTVLFVGGMAHIDRVLTLMERDKFPELEHENREMKEVCTLSEKSCREVLAEFGWISTQYEEFRSEFDEYKRDQKNHRQPHEAAALAFPPDRQQLIYRLYKEASRKYERRTGHPFPGYNLRNIMKFARNYAHIYQMLMPDLYQILASAKGCVDHNYAYEVWELGTHYPHLRNVDSLQELDLSAEDIWGRSKLIRFHMRQPSRKGLSFSEKRKDRSNIRFKPPGPFTICSYPPEDLLVENFGKFLQKKGTQILTEDNSRTIPFSSSLEDGIDTRETIRHWYEKKLYVKVSGKPPGGVGSVVMVFDEDSEEESQRVNEKFPWKTTWLGEHEQESDMAFYATSMSQNVVGPGISRCEYGGFMMSYPPRRMFNVWSDTDYADCQSKGEVLLAAAIDYAVKPVVVYVAAKPPRSALKSYARRYGKKVVYLPIGQLSPVTLNGIRVFHVLDGHDKRNIAGEYIY